MSDLVATCELCGEKVDALTVLDHFRSQHPSMDWQLQTWPDGEPVLVDVTIEPEDFA